MSEISPFFYLWNQVTKPDNVPAILILTLTAFYCWLTWKQAKINDERGTPYEAEQSDKIQVWPNLVRVEFLMSIGVILFLTIWSIYIDAPLEEPANPTLTPNPSKAPWYFLGLQELLVYFDPWIAGVILPTLIIFGLIAIPYIDVNQKGNGYYTIKERKFAISMFAIGFILLWVSLIVVGTFFRGPGWNLFTPWEYWDAHKVVPLNNRDFTEIFGIPSRNIDNSYNWVAMLFGSIILFAFYSIGIFIWKKYKDKSIMKDLGLIRYATTAFFTLSMGGVIIKILLRLLFNVKYLLATPFFNI